MAKVKGLTENMVAVLKVLAAREGGKGFAREVFEAMEGKTFNGVNATLAAAAGKGWVTKAKDVFGDKMLTKYTITEAGAEVIAEAGDEGAAETEAEEAGE